MTDRPVTPATTSERPRRPWGAVVAAAVAVAVLATVGVALLNRNDRDGSSAGGVAGVPSTAPGTSSGAPDPQTLSQVVLPYGGKGHPNDFGTAGTDRAYRPAGWSPWTAEVEPGVGTCALSPKVLVCPGSGGAVTGLSAADGKQLWKVQGRGEGLRSGAQYPAVVGDTAYVTGPDGVVAYGVLDGKERNRIPGPGGDWAVKGTDLLDGVLYSTYVNVRDERTGLATAVRLTDGKVLWRTPLDALPEQPVVADGRVFVPLGIVPVALDARTGKETARGTEACGDFTVHEKSGSVLCSSKQDGTVGVLDPATLTLRRTLGSQVSAGPAVNADGLVAVIGASGEVVTYDLESGREKWRVSGRSGQRVYLVGDRVVVAGTESVVSYPAAGPADDNDWENYSPNMPDGFTPQAAGDVLAAGGAVFLALPDGLVVSGYLP